MRRTVAFLGLLLAGCPHTGRGSLRAGAIRVPDATANVAGNEIDVTFVLENDATFPVTVQSIDWSVKVAGAVLAHSESSVQLRLPPGHASRVDVSVAVETLGLLSGSRSASVIEGTLGIRGLGASPAPSFRLPVTLVVEGR